MKDVQGTGGLERLQYGRGRDQALWVNARDEQVGAAPAVIDHAELHRHAGDLDRRGRETGRLAHSPAFAHSSSVLKDR